MSNRAKAGLVSLFTKLSSDVAIGVGAFGFVDLLSREFNISLLNVLLPAPSTIRPSSALCFGLAGISLWFLRPWPGTKPTRWITLGLPGVIAFVGLLSVIERILGANLGLDRLLLRDEITGPSGVSPFPLFPTTGLNFLLMGSALALLSLPVARRYVIAQCCAVLAGLQSFLFLMEYAYSYLLHSGAAHSQTISLSKTFAFLLLMSGILLVRPDRGLMAVATDAGSGGKLLRRGLSITVVVPFVLCWFEMVKPRAGYYGTEFRLALVATSIIGVFGTLIWGYARSLMVADDKRKRAEDFLSGQKRVFEMVSKGAPLTDTLSELVRLMESQGDDLICSILFLDRDGVHLRHGASPSLPTEYTRAIDGSPIGPATGSCGTAAFRRQAVRVDNIAMDPLWADYKDVALRHGLRGCWSTPIFDERHSVVGTFAIYYSKPANLTPQFLRLVEAASYTASICIEHHRVDALMRENVVHLSMVYNSVADVIFHVRVEPDAQFRFESVNPAFYTSTGLKESQVIGKLLPEVIPEPSLSLVQEKYREAIRIRQTLRWEEETKYPTETKYGDVTVTPVFDSSGQCKGLIGSVHDVTERRGLEQQVRQSQKMEVVGQLAGGVAHDFNNLLTVINGYSEIIMQRLSPDDPNYTCAEEVKKAGDRAASLTHQLLAFSRRQVMKSQVLCLNSVINDMEKMLKRLIGEDVDLVMSLEGDLGSVTADPGQVEQILLNLAVNARDAMPRGGKLTIETQNVALGEHYATNHLTVRPGAHVMLAVSDSGTGMDAATQKRIFEPFFTTKDVGKGTGLGLSTVYGIVKQSEGNIWVYSEVGIGTTFKIYLPRVDKPAEVVEPAKLESKLPGGNETILLVEDEPSVRLLVRTTLESNGYQVLEATNGAEALLIGEQHQGRIHFLLTDLVMPGISGRVLAEQLTPRRPELKVLFLSGYTDDVVVRHGALAGKMAFLQKPFTPDALARKVREVMDAS